MKEAILRSSIKPSLMRKTLWQGTVLAALGAFIFLYAGVAIQRTTLQTWGIPILGVGLALITLGLLPYRRLTRLELNPYKIVIASETEFTFFKGIPLFTIPFAAIDTISFYDGKKDYGICIKLKNTPTEKVIVHTSSTCLKVFQRNGCDLFFPYFTRRSFDELKSVQGT